MLQRATIQSHQNTDGVLRCQKQQVLLKPQPRSLSGGLYIDITLCWGQTRDFLSFFPRCIEIPSLSVPTAGASGSDTGSQSPREGANSPLSESLPPAATFGDKRGDFPRSTSEALGLWGIPGLTPGDSSGVTPSPAGVLGALPSNNRTFPPNYLCYLQLFLLHKESWKCGRRLGKTKPSVTPAASVSAGKSNDKVLGDILKQQRNIG